MAIFTPGFFVINAGEEVQHNFKNYLDVFSIENYLAIDNFNNPNHTIFMQQLINVKKAFSNDFIIQNGFNILKTNTKYNFTLYSQSISKFHKLYILYNSNNITVDIPLSSFFKSKITNLELLFSSRQNIINCNSSFITFKPQETLLILTKTFNKNKPE